MKNVTQQPIKRKWTGPNDKSGKFIRLKWAKESRVYLYIYTCRSSNTGKMGQSISTEDGQTIKTALGILQENTG